MESARQGSISVMAARALGPVSGHPLFPAIVSLWFAALFGLGSLAVCPLPVALVLALAGGLTGALLGRTIAAGRARASKGSRVETYQPVSMPEDPAREEAEAEIQEQAFPVASPEAVPVQEVEAPVPPEPVVETTVVQLPPLGKAAQRLLAADLDALSPLHLVERLSISLERRRASMSRIPARPASPAASLRRVHSAPAARIDNARADSARIDNERVLRSALATLQSVKGAA